MVALLSAAVGYCAGAAGAIVHGRPIPVSSSPWTVVIALSGAGEEPSRCTGAIIRPLLVVTAAHCVFQPDGTPIRPGRLLVRAGVSDFLAPERQDSPESRRVASVRVHPGYAAQTPGERRSDFGWDDVAVLRLAQPLHLDGTDLASIPLARSGPYPAGEAALLAGFGRQVATREPRGPLEQIRERVDRQGTCGFGSPQSVFPRPPGSAALPSSAPLLIGNSIELCAAPASGASCFGDSGAGLVSAGLHPHLIGILGWANGVGCAPGAHDGYAYVGAPEIRDFILGDDHPPKAPRTVFTDLFYRTPLRVGEVVSCDAYGNPPHTRYRFTTTSGRLLARGPRYRVRASDLGTRIVCTATATNAGGTAIYYDRTGIVQPEKR